MARECVVNLLMPRPCVERLTWHSKQRAEEREVPEGIIDTIRDGLAFIVQGKDGTNYHVVRVSKKEWIIGVEEDGYLLTVMKKRDAKKYLRKWTNDLPALEHLKELGSWHGRPANPVGRYDRKKPRQPKARKQIADWVESMIGKPMEAT